MTLTEFLLARIEDDEAVARRFVDTGYFEFRRELYQDGRPGGRVVAGGGTSVIAEDWHGSGYVAVSEHIAHHDPAGVLADCAAKRAIVEEYVARNDDVDLMLGPDCRRQREWSGLQLALQYLAQPYTDHPDYREEWRP